MDKEIFEVGELRGYGNRYKCANKRVIVFVEESERPINKGNILEDLAWRRTHEAPMKPADLRTIIEPFLKTIGMEVKSVTYSRKAGCSMCPCSPGYVVSLKNSYSGKVKSVWIRPRSAVAAATAKKVAKEEVRSYNAEVATAFGASIEVVR